MATKSILAVHENGIFRPVHAVTLPENLGVVVQFEEPEAESQAMPETKAMTAADLLQFRGVTEWPEDPVEWQKKLRSEDW